MSDNQTLPILNVSILLLLKLFFLLGVSVYIVFAAVVVRQVKLMTGTIEAPLASFLRTIATAHFVLAVFIFLAALIFL